MKMFDLCGGRGTRMLEIWGRKNSFNVQKVLWCCEELGIPYRRYDAGGLFGGTDEDEYLARNPTGLVPTISDGDLTLWESNAIVRYLSASYGAGSLWPEDPAERALADKWMDYQLGTLFPAFKDALLGLVRTPQEQRNPEKIDASVRATAYALSVLDAHLGDNEYVAGPSLTMGDIALGSLLYRWLELEIDRPGLASIRAWHERLTTRPAYQKTVMVSFAMEDPPDSGA
jgi:glutathione S-transferase